MKMAEKIFRKFAEKLGADPEDYEEELNELECQSGYLDDEVDDEKPETEEDRLRSRIRNLELELAQAKCWKQRHDKLLETIDGCESAITWAILETNRCCAPLSMARDRLLEATKGR